MRINKALVKHETRNMKAMMLYFLLIAIGGILYFNSTMNSNYIDTLTRGMRQDVSLVLDSVRYLANDITIPLGIGILLMIYLQFKDSKSVEVGNFLKSLPINNREYYTTKLIGGLISLTVPMLVLVAGILLVRSNNMFWISDIYATSLFPEILAKGDSIINIISIFTMVYMVAISTYTFLFTVQYIVMNISAGLVLGSLFWMSPMFIIGSITMLYSEVIEKIHPMIEKRLKISNIFTSYIQPWIYPTDVKHNSFVYDMDYPDAIVDNFNINYIYYEGIMLKIGITLAIAITSIIVGYILSNKSRVEDSDAFISFKWARRVFVVGVTLCSALLIGDIIQLVLMRFNTIGLIPLQIVMIVGGAIGFIVSKKLVSVKAKQGGII